MSASPVPATLALLAVHTNRKGTIMRRLMLLLATVGSLAGAGVAAAAPSGAQVVRDEGCTTNVFGTTCVVTKTTTSSTTTPSGNISYSTNGTVQRTITFSFGGSYTVSTDIHLHSLLKDGEIHTYGEHYEEASEYVSATYRLSCISGFDVHWAGDSTQFSDYTLECTQL
jgi:hypothetical protein